MEYDKREADFEKELIPDLTIKQLSSNLMENFIKKWIERDGLTRKPTTEELVLTKGFGQREKALHKTRRRGKRTKGEIHFGKYYFK